VWVQNIVVEIAGIAALISDSSSISEQSGGISEINNAVRDMDRMTQKNVTMVEETNATTTSLAQDTEKCWRSWANS